MLVAWVCYFYKQKLSNLSVLGGGGGRGRREEWGVPVAYNTNILNWKEIWLSSRL